MIPQQRLLIGLAMLGMLLPYDVGAQPKQRGPTSPAAANAGFSWTLACEERSSAKAYDLDRDPEKLDLDESLNNGGKSKVWFVYRDGALGRYMSFFGEEVDLTLPAPLIMEIMEFDSEGVILARNPMQAGTAIEMWRIDLPSRQAQYAGISTAFGGGVGFGFYSCSFVKPK